MRGVRLRVKDGVPLHTGPSINIMIVVSSWLQDIWSSGEHGGPFPKYWRFDTDLSGSRTRFSPSRVIRSFQQGLGSKTSQSSYGLSCGDSFTPVRESACFGC